MVTMIIFKQTIGGHSQYECKEVARLREWNIGEIQTAGEVPARRNSAFIEPDFRPKLAALAEKCYHIN